MRVSTSQIFDTGALGIQRNQSELFRLQNQMSTGRRILAPEDDPIAAAEALKVTQSKGVNEQFLTNQATATTSLQYVDSQLGSVSEELAGILEKAVQAGNSTLGSNQKGMIAEELKQRLDNVLSLANSQDGTGLYIFAGTQTQTKPFQAVGAGGNYSLANLYVAYQGDGGQRALQANASQSVAISENGQDVFMQVRDAAGNVTGRSLFDSIKNLVDILDPNSGVAYTTAAYTQSLADLHSSIDSIAVARSRVGSKLQALDGLTAVGGDQALQYDERLSDLQDLDYAKTISDLSHRQLQLQASQLSFKEISQLSLFNIL